MDPIRFVIELDPSGGLRIEGPMHNKILFLGVLSLAQHMVMAESGGQEGRIMPVHGTLPPPPPSLIK